MTVPAIERVVPVPEAVALRAWECAVDLDQAHRQTIRGRLVAAGVSAQMLALSDEIVSVTVRSPPDTIGWAQARMLFLVHRAAGLARRA